MRPTSNKLVRKPLIHNHCHLICCVYIKGHMSICVNAHCLMLEVLPYIALNALNALNTVQKIKAMSKISKTHYTDFNALKAMYVKGVKDIKYYE